MKKERAAQSLPALIDGLLAEHSNWEARAESAIEQYLTLIAVSGVPPWKPQGLYG